MIVFVCWGWWRKMLSERCDLKYHMQGVWRDICGGNVIECIYPWPCTYENGYWQPPPSDEWWEGVTQAYTAALCLMMRIRMMKTGQDSRWRCWECLGEMLYWDKSAVHYRSVKNVAHWWTGNRSGSRSSFRIRDCWSEVLGWDDKAGNSSGRQRTPNNR